MKALILRGFVGGMLASSLFVLHLSSVGAQSLQPPGAEGKLPEIRTWFAAAIEDHFGAFTLLNEKYREALGRLLEAETQATHLEGALQVRKEIEVFGTGENFNATQLSLRLATLPALRTLQTTYVNEHTRILTSLREPIGATLREYDQYLGSLQDTLTRGGQLEEAFAVKQTRVSLKENPNRAVKEALGMPPEAPDIFGATAATSEGPTGGAVAPAGATQQSMTGRVLITAKGDVEVLHNGEKLKIRNQADQTPHFAGKTTDRTFRTGDYIVLRVRTPSVFRGIVAAIRDSREKREVAVKLHHWRFLGEIIDAEAVTADMIRGSQDMLERGTSDQYGLRYRTELGIRPEAEGGSDWVKASKPKEWFCIGFVLSAEMLADP